MNTSDIRGWLLQSPKPAVVRVHRDGEPQDIKIGGRSYSKVAETIGALDPEKLEAYDSTGTLLRACKCDASPVDQSSGPQLPPIISNDPQVALLHYYAERIAHAYQSSTGVAFDRLIDMADRMNDRAAAIEQRLERQEAMNRRLERERVEDALDRVEEEAERQQQAQQHQGGIGEQLLGSFLGGMNQPAPAATKPNGKSNGHSRKASD
jgi:hypothetical protein